MAYLDMAKNVYSSIPNNAYLIFCYGHQNKLAIMYMLHVQQKHMHYETEMYKCSSITRQRGTSATYVKHVTHALPILFLPLTGLPYQSPILPQYPLL